MIRSQHGTSGTTSLETERKHCADENEKSETAAAGWTLEGKQSDPITGVASDGAADNQLEDTCRRGQYRRLEREGQRRHLFNGRRIEDKKKTKTFGTVSSGQSQGNSKSWRKSDTREPVFPRESISQPCHRSKVQNASGAVLQLCGRRKSGACRGRRGRRGNRTIPELELQSRPTCERWRSPTGGTSLLPTSVRKAGWTETRAIVESTEGVEEASSDKVETTTAKNVLVWGLLGNGENKEAFYGHPRVDDDRCVLLTRRTLAVKATGPDHTNAGRVPSKTQSYDETIDLRNPGSPKWLQSWRLVGPQRGFSSTDTRTSPKSFEEQHVSWECQTLFRTSDAVRVRHWTNGDFTAPCWRSKKTVNVEVRQLHCTTRKIWKIGTDPVRSQQELTKLLQSHRLSSRAAYLFETPSRGRFTSLSDGGRLFLNLFSNERVGRAAQRLGVRAAFWNPQYGERYDVTHPANLRRLLRDIAGGGILGCVMSVPSTGWSVARSCRRPLRSSAQPWRIDKSRVSMLPSDLACFDTGNRIMRAVIK